MTRLLPSFHSSSLHSKAVRLAIAAGAVAGLAVLGACAESRTAQSVAGPRSVEKSTTFSGSGVYNYQGRIVVCTQGVGITYVANYDAAGTPAVAPGVRIVADYYDPNPVPPPNGPTNTLTHYLGLTVPATSGSIATCGEIYHATFPSHPSSGDNDPATDVFARINIVPTAPAGWVLTATDCIIDGGLLDNNTGLPYANGSFAPDCDNDGDAKVWANHYHGSQVTFTYSQAQSTAKIAPTATTCQDYANGTSATLSEIIAGFQGTKINSMSPGVFFYYARVTAGGGTDVVITQTQNPNPVPLPPYVIQQTQAYLYSTSCTTVATLPLTNGGTTASGGAALPAGSYILGVKYSTSAPKGTDVAAFPSLLTAGALLETSTFEVNANPTTIASVNTVTK